MKSILFSFFILFVAHAQNIIRVCLVETDKPVSISFKNVAVLYSEEGKYQFSNQNDPSYVFVKDGLIYFESKGKYQRSLKYKADNNLLLKTLRSDNFIMINSDFRENGPIRFNVNAAGQLQVIAEVPLKRYLNYVVPNEIIVKEDKHYEAIKAQTVAARSYVLSKADLSKNFDVYADVRDQVYRSNMKVIQIVDDAVKETEGIILNYQNDILLTKFCSTIGGIREYPYYLSGDSIFMDVTDPDGNFFGQSSPLFRWEKRFSKHLIHERLEKWFPEKFTVSDSLTDINISIRIDERNRSTRVEKMTISSGNSEIELKGLNIRQFFHTDQSILPSRLFAMSHDNEHIIFTGGGYGHGEGLGQYEAMEMAERRYNFVQILKYFYPKAELAWLEY